MDTRELRKTIIEELKKKSKIVVAEIDGYNFVGADMVITEGEEKRYSDSNSRTQSKLALKNPLPDIIPLQ